MIQIQLSFYLDIYSFIIIKPKMVASFFASFVSVMAAFQLGSRISDPLRNQILENSEMEIIVSMVTIKANAATVV